MELTGQMQVTSWQEDEIRALNEGGRVTRASIGYRMTGDVDGNATEDVVMYYRPDGTAAVVGMWHVVGAAAGRTGTVMFESTGGYDGTTATAQVRPVSGSGTGGFAAVRGAGTTSASTEHVRYLLDLEF